MSKLRAFRHARAVLQAENRAPTYAATKIYILPRLEHLTNMLFLTPSGKWVEAEEWVIELHKEVDSTHHYEYRTWYSVVLFFFFYQIARFSDHL